MMQRNPKMWAGASAVLASLLLAGTAGAASLTVTPVVAPTAGNNDFTVINAAIQQAVATDVITIDGDFDWSEPNARASYELSKSSTLFQNSSWNRAFIRAVKAPAGVNNVTIKAAVGGGSVTGPSTAPGAKGTAGDDYSAFGFLYLGEGGANNNQGWTVDGLELSGFQRTFVFKNGVSGINNFTIKNCDLSVNNYRSAVGIVFAVQGGTHSGFLMDNNNIDFIANAGNSDDFGFGFVMHAIRWESGGNMNGAVISNNTFTCSLDGTATVPDRATSFIMAIFNNSNQTGGFTVQNNTFDGSIPNPDGPGLASAATIGVISAKKYSNTLPVYDGNTFINYLRTFEGRTFNPGVAADTLHLTGNTFTDCGWAGPGLAPGLAPELSGGGGVTNTGANAPGELDYQPAIANASGSIYSAAGGYSVRIDLATTVNGVTGIPMLNAISSDPTFFESIPDGVGGFAQGGILAANVIDVPGTVYTRVSDDQWKFTDRFARPTPAQDDVPNDLSAVELAFGYNATGPAIAQGNPDALLGNAGPIVLTADTEYPIGTRINTNLTIMSDQSKAGTAKGTTLFKIQPLTKQLAGSIFRVEAGVTLTLQDVELTGDNPSISGLKDALTGVSLTTATSGVVITNSNVSNFLGGGVTSEVAGSSVSIDNSVLTNSATGVQYAINRAPATLSVTDSIIRNMVQQGLIFDRPGTGNFTVTGNVFDNALSLRVSELPDTLTLTNNLFARAGAIDFSVGGYGTITTLNASNNWYSNIYGVQSESTGGVITGNIDVYYPDAFQFDNDIAGGTRVRDANINSLFPETAIVSNFDRDLDALPDAFELGGTTDRLNLDSDNDTWPDGVEVAEGTDPFNVGDFPAGTFVIDADLNVNGIADWYEDALLQNTGITTFLGDVLRNGGVALDDAVRGLQIVNGAFPKNQSAGDINALDVTGQGGNSLANPLQILRFQAGVRTLFPAIPGID